MARPTKLTPATERVILDALRVGATRTAAFEAAGIHRRRIAGYLRDYVAFRHAVMEAEAAAELTMTIKLRQFVDQGSVKALTFWLERRRHADWGRVDRVEVEIRRAAEQVAARTGADPDWLIKRAAEIAASAERAET